jgi:thiamine-phosphate pyrophosphorylase
VHLGPEDLTTLSARRILGAKAVIGGTANNLSTALQVAAGPVNYLGVGPVFETGSKSNPAPVLGLDGLREIAAAVSVPVFAIGGITAERVPEVLGAGAYGVAVLAAVVTSADPAVAARAIRERIDSR